MPILSKYDWPAIESEYRAGQLSIREISRQYGAHEATIRKRAKKEKWERDLTDDVRRKVRAKMVREEARSTHASDEQIVDEAAERALKVIKTHQRNAQDLRSVIATTTRMMNEYLEIQNEKDAAERELTELKKVTEMGRNCAQAMDRLVTIERNAHNLDDVDRGKDRVLVEIDH